MGRALVIVESPAKARTIGRLLGGGYDVAASIGHVRDLPESANEIPKEYKSRPWARLGVDVDDHFKPLYVIPSEKKEQVRKLKALVKEADRVYLATDEDREGESISWHLLEVLKPALKSKVKVQRLVFHEITPEAIERALQQPRDIDERLVRAQETRRVLDRLFGYEVSPLLWKKIRPKLSAGRVQSVAVKLVVERERERMAFHSSSYWDVKATFKEESASFNATLATLAGRSIAGRGDFDSTTGHLKTRSKALHLDEQAAKALVERLASAPALVRSVEERPFREHPSPPFITSTLQQEANRKLRWSARRTMQVAQRLYENGWITYMRTDSTVLSNEALEASRSLIRSSFGDEYLPASPRRHTSKSKLAQEAHEAIRPAGNQFRNPSQAAAELQPEESRLYELIWMRTVASQMEDARGTRVKVQVKVEDTTFNASGKSYIFLGFRRAYVETRDDQQSEEGQVLPRLEEGQPLATEAMVPQGHETKPPARLTEATLVKEMEARGIGRPSTYASIIETIQNRGYVFRKGSALVPTFTAFSVTNLLSSILSDLVDYAFTAQMEDELDQIALGRLDHEVYLGRFYRGADNSEGLRTRLDQALAEVDAREICSIPIGQLDGEEVLVRVGRFGPYLSIGDRRADIPDHLPPDEMDMEKARELLDEQSRWPKVLGSDPETGEPISVMSGPYGFYVQRGEKTGKARPPRAGLLKGMDPADVDLDTALQLLSLPKILGRHPETDEEVLAANGRFGPFIKSGGKSRSVPADKNLLSLSLQEAVEILKAPTTRQARASASRELGTDPESGAAVKLVPGRYGPYVTNGSVNATVPKDQDPEKVTLEEAMELIRKRAARGPARRSGGARGGAGKKATSTSKTRTTTTARRKKSAKS